VSEGKGFNKYDQPVGGHFGQHGGRFVAETLMHALDELEALYERARKDPEFQAELAHDLEHFVGRPTPLYHAARLSRDLGGAQIYLKREDLNHTGAHKINNTVGQALLAKRMGKRQKAEPERLSDEAARGGGGPRQLRLAHPEGCAQ
jgi:tryptophan synthase beta chain